MDGGGFERGGNEATIRLYLIDSGSRLAGGPSTSTRSPLLFFERWRHENTRALARELPPGGGPFHVGGSRVPGPNTFLIEMFIGGTTRNRAQSMKGKRFITGTGKLAIKKVCLRGS